MIRIGISRISCKGKCRCLPNIPTLRPKKPLPTPLYRGTPIGLGLVMGTAMNGVADIAETQRAFEAGGSKRASPSFVPRVLGNMAACQVAIAHDLQGPSFTLNTACSSGDDAITLAAMLLQSGAADAMVVLGGESINCPLVMASLASARVLASGAGRPFDKERDGFVIGEGGGALVLETEEHAKARGARIYAELLGAANGNDAFHMTTPASRRGRRRGLRASGFGSGGCPVRKRWIMSMGMAPGRKKATPWSAPLSMQYLGSTLPGFP